jgi:YegS/Rv2252/BmrU family lipid kinase
MRGKVLFILNPEAGAGRARRRWQELERLMNMADAKVEVTHEPGEAQELAQTAAAEYEILVAAGGDGTVREVANGILSSGVEDVALACIPLGTGNDFAGGLDIRTAEQALRALKDVRIRKVDVIRVQSIVEGRSEISNAISFAAVGLVGELVKATTKTVKHIFGPRIAYPVGLFRALFGYQAPRIRATCDGEVFEDEFMFAGASNGELAGGGLRLAPGARLDDGLLNVNLIGGVSRFEALSQLRLLRHGRHTSHPKVRYFTAARLEIESAVPMDVVADGELIGHTPASLVVQPKALKVVTLAESEDRVFKG